MWRSNGSINVDCIDKGCHVRVGSPYLYFPINRLLQRKELHEVLVFEHEGLTNLLFTFDGVCIDVGRLAMWRIRTRTQFGSTWLSDYVENQLGGFSDSVQRPDCPLILANGNIFDLMAVASRTLKEQGQDGLAKQMVEQITNGGCNSYEDALNIIGEYVNITSVNNQAEEGMGINELEM